jgi:xanthine dehydrogenase YagT iron-sulfur-binding subunit
MGVILDPAADLATAPAFAVHLADGMLLTPASFGGETLVIGFFDDLAFPGGIAPDELDRARAELRALGAALLAISAGGLWFFRPDDEVQCFAGAASLDAQELSTLRRRFAVPESKAAVFILDDTQAIRFASIARECEPTFVALVEALSMAGRAVLDTQSSRFTLTRRQFVLDSLIASFSLAFLDGARGRARAATALTTETAAGDIEVTLMINGVSRKLRIDPRVTLLDALRERLGLSGTKKGCDQGQCGACTVLVDGRRVNACLTLALTAEGLPITTIEGLASGDALHPMQAAFVAEDGFQCGYCTSGQIMSALGLLAEHRRFATASTGALDDGAIREQMSGNICRCGAYPNIVAAIKRARKAI